MCIPPRDSTSTCYKTVDTDIQHCIHHITNIPHSVPTGDINAHSTLWYLNTDDHRGQLIADGISNSDHITLNTDTPTKVPNTALQQTSSPDIATVSNTLYNQTFWTTQHNSDGRQTQYTNNNCRLLPDHIVCKITQRNNMRRAYTWDPALKLINYKITSDLHIHKQNLWKEYLDAHWDHRHNTRIIWKNMHGASSTHTQHLHNIQ